MKKLLVLVFCLLFVGIMLYQTGFFSYVQGDHSMVRNARVEVEHKEYSRNMLMNRLQPYQPAILKPDSNAYEGSPFLERFVSYQWPGSEQSPVHFWDRDLTRAVDKIVTATNNSNIPVYIRTVFAFEALDTVLWKNVCNTGSSTGMLYHGRITIHGDEFELYSYTYDDPLQPGQSTTPSLLQIALDANATSNDMRIVANGYEIMSATQACQASGLPDELMHNATADQVMNTLLGQISTDQHPWLGQ